MSIHDKNVLVILSSPSGVGKTTLTKKIQQKYQSFKIYPKTPVPLKSKNTFTLLISVLLSAQCTDVNVNNVTKKIYPKYFKPEHFVKLGRKKIEKLIKKIGNNSENKLFLKCMNRIFKNV